MDRPRGDRFGDDLIDHPDDRTIDGGNRHSRMPSRWSSSGSPHTQQQHRHPRGGGGDNTFSGAGRHHPYRDHQGGGPGGFRGGFGQQMSMGGNKRGFHGRGASPEYNDATKFVKLFIGSVPRTATEEDIRPLFEEHGDVIEVAVIKDKKTGQPQGCCFVKYPTSEEAERAITALHNQYTLPGGSGPIQVRYADGERENIGTPEHKLFVASISRQATEKEIEEIFSPYGFVEDVYIMRDEVKQSRGCGFVKFSSREMAAAALNALHGSYVMRGCDQPLIVRFANPKKPRPGESRGGPAFGGPGFGPRSDTSLVIRPSSHLDEPMGGNILPNAWQRSSPQLQGPPSQGSNQGFGTQNTAKDAATSYAFNQGFGTQSTAKDAANSYTLNQGFGTQSTAKDAATSYALNQGFGTQSTAKDATTSYANSNTSVAQVQPSLSHQILPLQKPLTASQQDLPAASLQMHHPQHVLTSQPQAQNLQPPIQQLAQLQPPQSIPSFNQTVLVASQPFFQQQNPSASSALQTTPLGIQQQVMMSVPSSTTSQQLHLQPIQQLPSQLPQVLLQQQAQALQSSFQSSQQAIFQLQQQLHQMQQQSSQQQGPQGLKQQSPWTEQQTTSGAPASTPAAVVPSTTSVTSDHPVTTSAPLTCNWTEHTSPEGFKYYYNSATRESKWEKPEELTISEQQQHQKLLLLQQQQQKLAVQQLQLPVQDHTRTQGQLSQQLPQTQQEQAQMQIRQQAQLQLLQPALGFQYQASGLGGNQNIQGSYYTQLQASNTVVDPARVQQGIQSAQEWAWNNKPAGS